MENCQLCYTSLAVLFPDQMQTIWNGFPIQEIVSKCDKYLPKDLLDPNINWNLPICEECRENTKQLVQLDLKLEQVNLEIKSLIDRITTKILNERQNYQLLVTNISLSIPPTDIHLLNSGQEEFTRNPSVEACEDLDLPISKDSVYDDSFQDETLSMPGDNVEDSLPEASPKKRRKTVKTPRKEKNSKSNLNGTKLSGKITSSDLQMKSGGGYACPNCNKKFTRLDILKRHDCGSTTFECGTCGKSFSSQGSLQIHNRIHTGEKPHKCETCGKSFTLPHHLRLHLVTHTEEKPYQCEICKKCFREKNYLLTHKRQHSTDENERKKYKCDICSKSFTLYKTLKYHLVVHTGESKYKCQICGKACGRKRELYLHELTHSTERQFTCSYCSKSFTREETLKVHEVLHTGRKDFQCDACGASYYTAARLYRHKQLKHLDEGDFICDVCGKLYKTQIEVNLHRTLHDKPVKRRHSSPKRFTCGVCDRSYSKKCYLVDHQQVVHVVTTITSTVCDQCGKDFDTNDEYHNHKLLRNSSRCKCEICKQAFRTRCSMICHFNEKHTESEYPFKCGCGSAYIFQKDLYDHKRNVCTVKRVTTTKVKKQVHKKKSKAKAKDLSQPNISDSNIKVKGHSRSKTDLSNSNLRRSGRVRNRNVRIAKQESEEDSENSSDSERDQYQENSERESECEQSTEIKTEPGIWIKEEPVDFSD